MVTWIWLGGFVMVFGTLLSAFPGRRRDPLIPSTVVSADSPAAGPPPDDDPTADEGRDQSDEVPVA